MTVWQNICPINPKFIPWCRWHSICPLYTVQNVRTTRTPNVNFTVKTVTLLSVYSVLPQRNINIMALFICHKGKLSCKRNTIPFFLFPLPICPSLYFLCFPSILLPCFSLPLLYLYFSFFLAFTNPANLFLSTSIYSIFFYSFPLSYWVFPHFPISANRFLSTHIFSLFLSIFPIVVFLFFIF